MIFILSNLVNFSFYLLFIIIIFNFLKVTFKVYFNLLNKFDFQ